MCLGGPSIPKDNSAEIARRKEEERKAKIAEGRASIDEQFNDFDDAYFGQVSQDYQDYYFPQLEDQYDDARRKATLRLASKGGLNTSAGARSMGDLAELYQKNRTLIGDRSIAAGNSARSDVENARNDLYAQNRAAADPSAAASSAVARAGTLQSAPSYNPLGAVFADFINNVGTGLAAERNGYKGFNTGLFNNSNSKGSSKVIT